MVAGRNKQERKKKGEEIKKMSKSQRRQMKREKNLNNELKEVAATEDYDERIKNHTEIIQQIFLIYFRILKHKVVKIIFLKHTGEILVIVCFIDSFIFVLLSRESDGGAVRRRVQTRFRFA